jgi:WD40 repeat protein
MKMSPRWTAERSTTISAALNVTLIRAFYHKDPVPSVRFSADGKYLAAALKDRERHNNGRIFIYDVETGKKTWSVPI